MNKKYLSLTTKIAIPIALQNLLSSTLSIVDQIMVGSLGKEVIASIALSSKIIFFLIVSISCTAQTSSIMISQFYGEKNSEKISKSFYTSLLLGFIFTIIAMIILNIFPEKMVRFFTDDKKVISISSVYIRIFSIAFFTWFIKQSIVSFLRSTLKIKCVVYSATAAVLSNACLNYIFIFILKQGFVGAAIATVISSFIELFILIFYFKKDSFKLEKFSFSFDFFKVFILIFFPLFLTDSLWSFGTVLYTKIIAKLGIDAFTVTSILNPYQTFLISFFTGFGVASSIIVGNFLGENDFKKTYDYSKWLIKNILIFSIAFTLLSALLMKQYLSFFKVSNDIKNLSFSVMYIFLTFVPIKILNMALLGGILKTGGKTKINLTISLISTWLIGIPLSFLAVSKGASLSILIILTNIEEAVKVVFSLIIFKTKLWMKKIN